MSRLYGISERSREPVRRSALSCDCVHCHFCCESYMYGCPQRLLLLVTLVNPNNAPRSIPSAAATCVARRVDRAERASESATQLHLPCMHVFESTLLLSSCCSCTHLAHDHIDHDLSYDYDVRQTDSPKHALSVTTPLYDDDPVGPPAIETPGSWTWIVDDQRVFQKEQQQKITSRIVQHRW